jgi:pimeloyl-ACP methyl ester carboxylesterase
MRFALLSVLIGAAGAFGTGGALRTPAVPTGTAVVAQARDTGRVAVNGGTLYYETRGSGPAVVLLHGGGQDFTMWDSQMEPLAGAFRVTRYDARGHGRSTAPIGPYSMADDLRLVLDHIGADRAHLVGFSMGAGVALDFAVTHEARVLTLALISVTGPPPGAPIRPGAPPPADRGSRASPAASAHRAANAGCRRGRCPGRPRCGGTRGCRGARRPPSCGWLEGRT